MRRYQCACHNSIFFDNSQCIACGAELGFCPGCRQLVALIPTEAGYQCGNPECGVGLVKCFNYSEFGVCNRCLMLRTAIEEELCDCCRFNQTIPDLTINGNLERWRRLEAAKRRLFYDLDTLGLPYGAGNDLVDSPLAFDFKADAIPQGFYWRRTGKGETVYTGHANGLITINIREADDVQREMLRVEMGESQRTLIGHFRHEIGHYYWDLLIKGKLEEESRAVFGDHDRPTYAEALERYYQQGSLSDWQTRFISPYATMHPWEDFAETWAAYLDLVSNLDTAHHNGFGSEPDFLEDDLKTLVAEYQDLGIALNEINRSMGLLDVVPEIFVQPVVEKLEFIHRVVLGAERELTVDS